MNRLLHQFFNPRVVHRAPSAEDEASRRLEMRRAAERETFGLRHR